MCEVSQGGRLQFRYKFFAGSGWLVPELRLATAEKFYLKFFRKCFVVVAAEEVHHRREILSR